ncbi:MAG TPA: CpcT/CpeT family chromophore lyase [Steroidobacteraceae bacterium]|nr:CpcT/CpeT family chromophore lyase [Steroidobacteraceae bacterium]
MVALPAVLLIAAVGAADSVDVAELERVWSGVRDSSEQVVLSLDRGADPWPQSVERRVRTIVAPVKLPWLGAHVLYLEEFIEDDPEQPRRQLLLQLEPSSDPPQAVRAHLYSFIAPGRWKHLNYRPQLVALLSAQDILAASGCDLVLTRGGDQFRGGTIGRHCVDSGSGSSRYLDYQLVIGEQLYWYRRRLLQQSDGELQQEVIGFNRFEPNEAQLYACRIAWSPSGNARDLRPLTTLDLYEAGGHGRFVTPDGRTFELALHGRDWPFAVDRDALLLLLQAPGATSPLATAWAQMDEQQVRLQLDWLEVRCGSMAPESDELAQ